MSWSDDYSKKLNTIPEPGTVLRTKDGSPAKIHVILNPGEKPFIYAVCYLNCIVDEPIEWYLRGVGEQSNRGIKCILLNKSKDWFVRNVGLSSSIVGLSREVVCDRESQSKTSILVDIVGVK